MSGVGLDDPRVIPGLPLSRGIIGIIESESTGGSGHQVPDPFATGQLASFIEWLRAVPPRSASGLPRYLQAVFDEREDLQQIFPEVRSGVLDRFAWWVRTAGRAEHSSIRLLGHDVPASRTIPDIGRDRNGCDVAGFFTAEHGVGEAARNLTDTLRSAGVDVSTINYTDTGSRQQHDYPTDDVSRHRTLLMAMNADHLNTARQRFQAAFFADRYVIGQWFWEIETAPRWHGRAHRHVDELWASTRFIERMLRRSAPRRVRVEHMPLPVVPPPVDSAATRQDAGLDDRFTFLFMFDFLSVMKRKNPLGLIEAFTSAFPPGDGPVLVIKCVNGDKRPAERAALESAARGREDVRIVDRYLTRVEASTLMRLSDCYVSLHRSEGLGLTCAEAMSLGKPVIATGYSGNLDFMNEGNSVLIPWEYARVGGGAEGYDPRARWAEPDLAVAASEMRAMVNDPARGAALGARAAREMREFHSPEVSGARMAQRLREIAGDGGGR